MQTLQIGVQQRYSLGWDTSFVTNLLNAIPLKQSNIVIFRNLQDSDFVHHGHTGLIKKK